MNPLKSLTNSNLNMQDETNFLQCYICLQKVKKARMCPQCSKLACHQCLRTWMEQRRSQCPHCRRTVPLSSFADCQRFIDDLMGVFKKIDKLERPKEVCNEHGIQVTYFCSDCSIAICSDCGMFGSDVKQCVIQHRGHSISRLNKVYEQKKAKILSEMTRFDTKIEDYKRNGMEIKVELQKLMMVMQQKKGYLQAYFENILQKLDFEFKHKQSLVLSKFEANQEEIDLLDSLKQTIVEDLESYSQNQVIARTQQILNLISSLCQRQVEQVRVDTSFNTIHELVPDYVEFSYQLKKFSELDDQVVYSFSQNYNGIDWRLKIYPHGSSKSDGKWLSVFLEMSQGYENDTVYEYKIELINVIDESKTIVREYSSKFEIGQCWGYNELIELDQLKNGYLVADTLNFKYYVRNPNYKCLCNDQKRYVDKLQVRVKELERLVCDHNSSRVQPVPEISQDYEQSISSLYKQIFLKKHEIRNCLDNEIDQTKSLLD